jgi:hypothetical protein
MSASFSSPCPNLVARKVWMSRPTTATDPAGRLSVFRAAWAEPKERAKKRGASRRRMSVAD